MRYRQNTKGDILYGPSGILKTVTVMFCHFYVNIVRKIE